MENQNAKNVITTLFEYTSEGYDKREDELASLIKHEQELAKSLGKLPSLYAANAKSLKELSDARAFYEKTLNSSSTLKERDHFVEVKNALTAARAEKIKLNEETVRLNKTYAQTKKQVKDAEQAVKLYKSVLSELSKGMENANVSTDALLKAQKILKEALKEPGINTERYQQLSMYLAQVTKTINTLNAALRNNAKNFGATEAEIKRAEQAAENYRLVMAELSKGQQTTTLTAEQLLQAQRYLKEEMSKPGVGAEKYRELGTELERVKMALSENANYMKEAARLAGVHENSIAALEIRQRALTKAILEGDRADPGYKEKTLELRALTDELAKAHAEAGVFTKNIGVTKSTFDGLGWSIAQITREAPAFAHSMTTGFMAISNNLPMLYDEVKKLRIENAALNAEGKKTPPIWKSILKAGLSWNTAISVGIVLLTMYGKDMVEWVAGLIRGKEAAVSVTEALEGMNEAMDFKSLGTQIADFKKLQNAWVELGGDVEKQKKFLEENREELDKTGIAVMDIVDAENLFVKNSEAYITALTLRAKAAAGMKLASEEYEKAIQVQTENADEIAQYTALQNAEQQRLNDLTAKYGKLNAPVFQNQIYASKQMLGFYKGRVQALQDEAKAHENNAAAYIKASKEMTEAERDALQSANLDPIDKDYEKRQREALAAARKAADEQKKRNDAYIKAYQERLKAREEYAKAEESGDEQLLAATKKNLENKNQAVAEAAQKHLTITQAEYDALALQEYQSEQTITKIHQEGADKRADAYMKDVDAVRDAQKKLFEAQRKGNKQDIGLYTQLLAVRRKRLEAHNQETFTLTEQQQEDRQQKDAELNQAQIDEYIKQQDKLADLQTQYQSAKNLEEAQYYLDQIDRQKEVVHVNAEILKSLGVQTEGLYQEKKKLYKSDEQTLSDTLQQSLQIIKQYAGKSKSLFGNLSISVTSLLSKAFDARKIKKEMDELKAAGKEVPKEMEKQYKESTSQISALAASAAMTTLDGVSSILSEGFEREKEAVEDFYEFQAEQAQRFYDDDLKALDRQLKNKEISEARYTLEKLKLDDKQKEKEKKQEREKANAIYEINLKQFRAQQAQDAIAATIATALAIMQTLAKGAGFWSTPLVPVVTALGAAQVAAIYAQKPPEKPKFEKGGLVDFQQIEGPSHAQGGVPVSIGGRKVAEVEGGEGALIVSKKAMKRKSMRAMLQAVEALNEAISSGQSVDDMFAEGGYLSYEDFFNEAKSSLKITKRRRRSVTINGQKIKLKPYGFNADAAIDDYAEKIAKPKYNTYAEKLLTESEARIDALDESISKNIGGNAYLKSQGISSIAQYNTRTAQLEEESELLDEKINAYKELKDAALEALKAEMDYDNRIADFDKQKTDAEEELADKTLEFNERVLDDLYRSGQIQKDEYLSLLDQVRNGYGAKTQDIIDLKKKEVEAVKKLIEEERSAEVSAANEIADYRTQALEQIRSEWEEQYNAVTEQITENVLDAGDAVNQLTGEDLDRYHQLLAISQEIEKMNEDYARNDSILNDGVIQSREEQARLVEQQKQIQEQLAIKEKEAEDAKAAFEELRQKNMESALKAFEAENFQNLMEQIKGLGSALQEEGNKWTLDKQITADLNESLSQINAKYDEQVAAQDAIVSGLEAEIEKAELLHDKKVANIKAEEEAFKKAYEQRQKLIEQEYANNTAELTRQAQALNSLLAAIKAAGISVGIAEYEKQMEKLNEELQNLPTKQYADGGAIDLGGGLFEVAGASHDQGGVAVSVGGRKIAEVEGAEKMFVMNRLASVDPDMVAALRKASEVNARYSGVDFIDIPKPTPTFEIDYDLLAEKIGQQINMRPQPTYITYQEIGRAAAIAQMVKRASRME